MEKTILLDDAQFKGKILYELLNLIYWTFLSSLDSHLIAFKWMWNLYEMNFGFMNKKLKFLFH